MTKKLHIFNGDIAANIFRESNIEGDILVWREMLCEGQLTQDFGSDEFWKKRYTFFEKELEVDKLTYYDKTLKNIIKLEDVTGYTEIVLWFEYDLFCQINMLAACSYLLKSFRKDVFYHLVCTGKEKGKKALQTLSDYSSEGYKNLYENKTKISKMNLEFTDTCWNLYVENNKEKIANFNFNKIPKFAYLQKAIDQHLLRFPSENGLNQIENKILNIIHLNAFSENQIILKLLSWQKEATVYGFSDAQYKMALKKLGSYYTIENGIIMLNPKAKLFIECA